MARAVFFVARGVVESELLLLCCLGELNHNTAWLFFALLVLICRTTLCFSFSSLCWSFFGRCYMLSFFHSAMTRERTLFFKFTVQWIFFHQEGLCEPIFYVFFFSLLFFYLVNTLTVTHGQHQVSTTLTVTHGQHQVSNTLTVTHGQHIRSVTHSLSPMVSIRSVTHSLSPMVSIRSVTHSLSPMVIIRSVTHSLSPMVSIRSVYLSVTALMAEFQITMDAEESVTLTPRQFHVFTVPRLHDF